MLAEDAEGSGCCGVIGAPVDGGSTPPKAFNVESC